MYVVRDITRDAIACLIIEVANAIKAGQQVQALDTLQELSDVVMSDREFAQVHHVIIK